MINKKGNALRIYLVVSFAMLLTSTPSNSNNDQISSATCSPNIKDINGNVTIYCENINKLDPRIVPRGNLYAELSLSSDPFEYTKGVICNDSAIRNDLIAGYNLKKAGENINPVIRSTIDQFFDQVFDIDSTDSLTKSISKTDPTTLNCQIERICNVRGSVPITVKSNTMYVFDIPMRHVTILAGHCKDRSGFVNERFIDF